MDVGGLEGRGGGALVVLDWKRCRGGGEIDKVRVWLVFWIGSPIDTKSRPRLGDRCNQADSPS